MRWLELRHGRGSTSLSLSLSWPCGLTFGFVTRLDLGDPVKKKFVVAVVLCAGLSACAAPASSTEPVRESPVSAPSPSVVAEQPSGPGTYAAILGEAPVSVDIPGEADAETAAVLSMLGVKAGSFVSVTIDNRKGQQGTGANAVGLSTAEGERVEYTSADALVKGVDKSKLSTADYNRVIRWENAADTYTEAGQKRTVLLASTEPMPAFVKADIGGNTISGAIPLAKQ